MLNNDVSKKMAEGSLMDMIQCQVAELVDRRGVRDARPGGHEGNT